jgi:SAM-dependent methyltransferase
MLKSRFGLACYSLLQNRWAWACLSQEEREAILRGNIWGNTQRPDYADPLKYQGGVDFDTIAAPRRELERTQLAAFLERVQPASVLELGPGSGYLTRTVTDWPTLTRYVAVDVNPAFLDHVRARLTRPDLSTAFIVGTIEDVPAAERFDAVVMCSVVHHIPNRYDLFRAVRRRLRTGGRVFATDPTHYLHRLLKIVRKWRRNPGYLAGHLAAARRGEPIGTHAMCTLGEYRAVAAATNFAVRRVEFDEYSRFRSWWPLPGQHFLAAHMMIECEATDP